MRRTTPVQVAALRCYTDAAADGEASVIAPGGPLHAHGFTLHRLDLRGDAAIIHDGPCVVFVHRGEVDVAAPAGSVVLTVGDTIGLPAATSRLSGTGATLFIVRGAAG